MPRSAAVMAGLQTNWRLEVSELFSEDRLAGERRDRLAYAPPTLTVHGTVADLTAGGSKGQGEAVGVGSNGNSDNVRRP